MGIRTGKPRGRPPGAKSQRTRAREDQLQAAAARVESAIDEPFTGDSHALLMMIYKDPSMPMLIRIDAAKTAIGFEKPRLASVEANVKVSEHEDNLRRLRESAMVIVADGEPLLN